MKLRTTPWVKTLLRPGLLSTLILLLGLIPLFYEEAILGRKLPASLEMLYTLVVIHICLFLIRTK